AGLAISGNTIFISDSRNNRIQKFSLDGKFQGKFGSPGNGPGQFNLPWGIAVDKEGSVYVADWRNDRIQQFTADRQWQASFGSSGSGVGQFNRPNGVGVDQDGDIYVADWLNNRVQVLAHDGRFITQLHGDHSLSQWGKDKLLSNPDMIRQRHLAMSHSTDFDKHFSHPCAVKVDDQRRIAVLDHTRGRIQLYTKSREPVLV
ncbi:MAG TPA: NHL repeat-containing protein, partial [Dehalococcoidia bacterium]|nr:NHL repeat-containing protein [Dehalococcoidia bacterium]